ncbi:MAG: thioesterase family protein [bacterium]|nr:thioesterase family protein [bacterium]
MTTSARVQLPTFDEVDELPMELRTTVQAEYLDINNHMNIRHYLGLHVDAFDGPLFSDLGFGAAYVDRGLSFFQVDNHLRYLSEVRGGDEVSVHVRFLSRTEKTVHAVSFILNRSTSTLANTMEFLMLHVDLHTRRAVDVNRADMGALDQRIETDSTLAWTFPTSGCIPNRR